MKIISKYIARGLFKNLLTILFAVVVIYVAVDFFEKIDDFMEAKIPLSIAGYFFLLRIPFVVAQVFPVGVLLSALVVIGLMAKHNEIIAYASGGGSGLSLLKPVVALGILSSLFLFMFNEMIVPATAVEANRIWYQQVRGEGGENVRKKTTWFHRQGMIGRVGRYYPETRRAKDITLNYYDQGFKLVKRIDALEGAISGTTWTLYNAMESMGGRASDSKQYPELQVEMDFTADQLHDRVKRSDEMSLPQLMEHIQKIEAEGYKATRFQVDLAAKVSFPLVCLIMSILGGAMALRGKKGEGLAVNVVLGMGLAFSYWVVHSLCISLGYAGMYSPVLAAWTANALFVVLAAVLVYELA
ncbi:MAG: LPS export ABC transporter permease LptG [Desulfatibacillum sp.]|nr:LPS export ABC transporter permease LptG [Desulfatibacillum sp.]